MTNPFKPFRCPACGAGVQLVTGPGRTAAYQVDLDLPVPDDFAIPTCSGCGEEYLTAEEGAALARAQAPAYASWQREHVRPLLETIKRAHGVTVRDIERVCGVGRTYLSHVGSGTKEASRTLVNLLEAYAREPQEFQRKLQGGAWNSPRLCWPPSGATFSEAPATFRDARAGAKAVPGRIVVPAVTSTPKYVPDEPAEREAVAANDLVA
jgi:hypothetical protein